MLFYSPLVPCETALSAGARHIAITATRMRPPATPIFQKRRGPQDEALPGDTRTRRTRQIDPPRLLPPAEGVLLLGVLPE
jgi:hypothetical protein